MWCCTILRVAWGQLFYTTCGFSDCHCPAASPEKKHMAPPMWKQMWTLRLLHKYIIHTFFQTMLEPTVASWNRPFLRLSVCWIRRIVTSEQDFVSRLNSKRETSLQRQRWSPKSKSNTISMWVRSYDFDYKEQAPTPKRLDLGALRFRDVLSTLWTRGKTTSYGK